MNKRVPDSTPSHRDQWLALLENQGVGLPTALHVGEVPGGLVQLTIAEPPGRVSLEGLPANVLMFNLSPVQAHGRLVKDVLSWRVGSGLVCHAHGSRRGPLRGAGRSTSDHSSFAR
jgi:hypothetical protein